VFEIGAHTIALSDDDLAWLCAAVDGELPGRPERYGLAARLRLVAAAAEEDPPAVTRLVRAQREIVRDAVAERLETQPAPSEAIKLLRSVLER
jgi:hypothetical protein